MQKLKRGEQWVSLTCKDCTCACVWRECMHITSIAWPVGAFLGSWCTCLQCFCREGTAVKFMPSAIRTLSTVYGVIAVNAGDVDIEVLYRGHIPLALRYRSPVFLQRNYGCEIFHVRSSDAWHRASTAASDFGQNLYPRVPRQQGFSRARQCRAASHPFERLHV